MSSRVMELRTLMDQALQACVALQNYSDESFNTFLSDDDAKITEVINNREKMIETLIGIEYKTNIIYDEMTSFDDGEALPPDVDDMRRSVRTILNDVTAKDMEIMKLIGGKMQTYKIETLKARNKRNLSAYMRTVFAEEPGDSIDFSK